MSKYGNSKITCKMLTVGCGMRWKQVPASSASSLSPAERSKYISASKCCFREFQEMLGQNFRLQNWTKECFFICGEVSQMGKFQAKFIKTLNNESNFVCLRAWRGQPCWVNVLGRYNFVLYTTLRDTNTHTFTERLEPCRRN